MNIFGFTTSSTSIAVIAATRTYTIDATHPNFDKIRSLLEAAVINEYSGFYEADIDDLIDLPSALNKAAPVGFNIDISTHTATFNGTPLHGTLLDFLLRLYEVKAPLTPWAKFMESLNRNPSYRSREQLFDFMQANQISINTNGELLLYKKVRSNYKDCHSGTISNTIGSIVKMDRPLVDDDPTRICSAGLHVAAHSYLASYSGERVMICAVKPEDVVSIPTDYNNAKMRCCAYRVVAEHTQALHGPTLTSPYYEEDELEDAAYNYEEDDSNYDSNYH